MKRWGFSGMPADSHGTTKSHRRPGCIGSGRDKSRVWPKQKMPGHMGGNKVWMAGLRVLRINYEEDILYLTGVAVPGDSVIAVRLEGESLKRGLSSFLHTINLILPFAPNFRENSSTFRTPRFEKSKCGTRLITAHFIGALYGA